MEPNRAPNSGPIAPIKTRVITAREQLEAMAFLDKWQYKLVDDGSCYRLHNRITCESWLMQTKPEGREDEGGGWGWANVEAMNFVKLRI